MFTNLLLYYLPVKAEPQGFRFLIVPKNGHRGDTKDRGKGYTPEKLRDLHFDVLMALTARNCGATVITSNGTGFELIKSKRDFNLEIW